MKLEVVLVELGGQEGVDFVEKVGEWDGLDVVGHFSGAISAIIGGFGKEGIEGAIGAHSGA